LLTLELVKKFKRGIIKMIITLFNQKGGVGKTTTAINLGSCLAELGKKVLLVDMDAQANTTSGLGIDKTQLESNIYKLLTSKQVSKEEIQEAVIETKYENLYLIASHISLANAEITLSNAMSRENILKRILDTIKDYFDYVIIDSPPSLGLLSINSLVACDKLIIPVSTTYFAIEGIDDLLNTVNLVRDNLKPDLDILGVLITQYDKRTKISKDIKTKLINVFGNKVFKTFIRTNIDIGYSQEKRIPINEYNKTCNGYIDYIKLAKEVITYE